MVALAEFVLAAAGFPGPEFKEPLETAYNKQVVYCKISHGGTERDF